MAKANNRRSAQEWEKIKELFRIKPKGQTLKAFAEQVNVSLRTLQSRMKKDADSGEPWETDISGAVKSQTKIMQQRVAAGLGKDTPITDEQIAIASAAATNMLVLERHNDAFGVLMDNIVEGAKLLKNQIGEGFIVIEKRTKEGMSLDTVDVDARYIAQSAQGLSSALERVVKLQRHHLGLDEEEDAGSFEEALDELANQADNLKCEVDE